MTRVVGIVLLAGLARAQDAARQAPPPPVGQASGEWKVAVQFYGVKKEPLDTAELVAVRGRVYQFLASNKEVVVFDATRKAVSFLDLGRKATASLGYSEIEAGLADDVIDWLEEVADLEKKATRADRIEAGMLRDMVTPTFGRTIDLPTRKVTLKNRSVEAEAVGEPDDDRARVALLAEALTIGTKLQTIRDDDNLPPFAKLEALAAIGALPDQRPAALAIVYRLAGPPRKFRWTYRLVPTISDREREAIRRIDDALGTTKSYPFDRYERLIASEVLP